ncbi:MAG: hypothetical protein KAR42_09365 [candidate division Zixibacteria bacterium]|nr:hypothetical protein [candidate division Zixibacteria bacterium]
MKRLAIILSIFCFIFSLFAESSLCSLCAPGDSVCAEACGDDSACQNSCPSKKQVETTCAATCQEEQFIVTPCGKIIPIAPTQQSPCGQSCPEVVAEAPACGSKTSNEVGCSSCPSQLAAVKQEKSEKKVIASEPSQDCESKCPKYKGSNSCNNCIASKLKNEFTLVRAPETTFVAEEISGDIINPTNQYLYIAIQIKEHRGGRPVILSTVMRC